MGVYHTKCFESVWGTTTQNVLKMLGATIQNLLKMFWGVGYHSKCFENFLGGLGYHTKCFENCFGGVGYNTKCFENVRVSTIQNMFAWLLVPPDSTHSEALQLIDVGGPFRVSLVLDM